MQTSLGSGDCLMTSTKLFYLFVIKAQLQPIWHSAAMLLVFTKMYVNQYIVSF